jgi:hypothetical protein
MIGLGEYWQKCSKNSHFLAKFPWDDLGFASAGFIQQ